MQFPTLFTILSAIMAIALGAAIPDNPSSSPGDCGYILADNPTKRATEVRFLDLVSDGSCQTVFAATREYEVYSGCTCDFYGSVFCTLDPLYTFSNSYGELKGVYSYKCHH